MKKRILSTVLSICLILGLSLPAGAVFGDIPTFSDVPESHWAYSYVEQAVDKGWVAGIGNGLFGVDDPVTYAQLSTMFVQAFYQDELAAYTGPTSPWYATYCGVIDQQGGFADTEVAGQAQNGTAVEQPVSRYELAHMLYNVLKAKGINVSIDIQKTHAETADWDSIPTDHWVVVAVCKETGIMGGVDGQGTFDGASLMTRAQACTVLLSLNSYVEEHAAGEPETPVDPVNPTEPADGTRSPFAFQDGETVRQMMARLNGEVPGYVEGYLTNGKPITEANIKEILAEAEESMPEGTPWSDDFSFDYSTKVFVEAGDYMIGGCGSFAAGLSDYIFGKDAPSTMHQNFDQLKVGDIIWIKDSSTGYNHIVIVTDVRSADGFFTRCSGNSNGMVQWGGGGQPANWSETRLAETYIFTRY